MPHNSFQRNIQSRLTAINDYLISHRKPVFIGGITLALVCIMATVIGIGQNSRKASTAGSSTTVGGRDLPIYNVETTEKKVALSFDAAWGNDDTRQILDILANHNIHVTFFMTGGWVESYPDDVKAIYEAGHDLGNHSESHPQMSKLSEEEITEELMSVHDKVYALTGYNMFLFRPPYGDYDNELIQTATKCGYYTIQWNVDSLDWKDYGVSDIITRVCNHKNLKNGSIILMHNGATYTASALDEVITGLEEQGYTIVPISELIIRDDFHMEPDGTQTPNNPITGTPTPVPAGPAITASPVPATPAAVPEASYSANKT